MSAGGKDRGRHLYGAGPLSPRLAGLFQRHRCDMHPPAMQTTTASAASPYPHLLQPLDLGHTTLKTGC